MSQQEEKNTTIVYEPSFSNANADGLIEHALLLIEDGDYAKADGCLEQALNIVPKNPMIYIGKLLIEKELRGMDELSYSATPLEESNYYQKAVRFADDNLRELLVQCNTAVFERLETERQEMIYSDAVKKMEYATTEVQFLDIKKLFDSISDYKDARILSADCEREAEEAGQRAMLAMQREMREKQKEVYDRAVKSYKACNASGNNYNTKIQNIQKAIQELESISDYEDAAILAKNYRATVSRLQGEQKRKSKQKKLIIASVVGVAVAAALFVFVLFQSIIPSQKYKKAAEAFRQNQYDEAVMMFKELGDYKDSANKIKEVSYAKAMNAFTNKQYAEAIRIFSELGAYSDSVAKIKEVHYAEAMDCFEKKDYDNAIKIFASIGEQGKADEVEETRNAETYSEAMKLYEKKNYDKAIEIFGNLEKYKDAAEKVNEVKYAKAMEYYNQKDYKAAYEAFGAVGYTSVSEEGQKYYNDSRPKIAECGYYYAAMLAEQEEYEAAVDVLSRSGEFNDSKEVLNSYFEKAAQQNYEKKDYSRALSFYKRIENYNKKSEIYLECNYQIFLVTGKLNPIDAVEMFGGELKGYKDSAEQRKKMMYAYIQSEYAKGSIGYVTETFHNYITELKKEKYEDSVKIYDNLYNLKLEITVNNDEDDWDTSMDSVSKYSKWYFHIYVTNENGTLNPYAETKLKYIDYFPNSKKGEGIWEDAIGPGERIWCAFWYESSEYKNAGTGLFTLEVYDEKNKLLGKKTVLVYHKINI